MTLFDQVVLRAALRCASVLILGIHSVATASAAAAELRKGAPDGVHLWRDLYSGMSRQRVAGLYPTKRAKLLPDCLIEVWPKFTGGKLVTVVLVDRSERLAGCYDQAVALLRRENGVGNEKVRSGVSGSGLTSAGFTRGILNMCWRNKPKSIYFTAIGSNGTFNIIHTVKPNYHFELC